MASLIRQLIAPLMPCNPLTNPEAKKPRPSRRVRPDSQSLQGDPLPLPRNRTTESPSPEIDGPALASPQICSQAEGLRSLLTQWQATLQRWSADGSLATAAARSLRLDRSNELLQSYRDQWAAGDFSLLPEVIPLASEAMKGTLGAFAAGSNRIYINREWLAATSTEHVLTVLNEELGHFLDAALNPGDTDGDEGEIFAKLLASPQLSSEDEKELRLQEDHGVVVIDNQTTAVEFAATSTDKHPLRYFLRIDGIAGDCTAPGFEGCFELISHNFDASTAAGALPQFTDLSVVLRPGASRTSFYQRLAAGQTINSLQIVGQATLPDKSKRNTYELRYGSSLISSIDATTASNSDQPVSVAFRSNTFGISSTPIS